MMLQRDDKRNLGEPKTSNEAKYMTRHATAKIENNITIFWTFAKSEAFLADEFADLNGI